MSRGADIPCKVYIGELPNDVREEEVEKEFSYYGRLKSTWVARNPPGFAFVEYEDPRDADDAIHGLDGQRLFGTRIRVEPCSGKRRQKPWERDSRGPPPRYDDFRRGGGPSGPPRRAFDPNDECYRCGERGHYAYDCRSSNTRRRSRSRSGGRRRSRSRSRGRRSPSPRRNSRDSRERIQGRSRSRSFSRGRSRSMD